MCKSIWFQLSSIINISSVHVQWIPQIGMPGNTLAAWDQAELRYPSVLGPYRPSSGEGSNSENETGGVPCPLHTGCALSHTSHYSGKTNPHCHWRLGCSRSHCMTVAQLRMVHSPLFATAPDNSLRCVSTAQVTTTRRSILFFGVRPTCRHVPPPTTSTEPTLDACGLFLIGPGPERPNLRPGMRERERDLPCRTPGVLKICCPLAF